MSGSPDSGSEGIQPHPSVLRKSGMLQIFGLDRKRGDRTAEFVRGIGDEPSLFVEHRPDTVEKTVDGGDERKQLLRNAVRRQFFQMVRLLRVEARRQFGKRAQASIDDDADQQHETRNEQAQRHDGPQRALPGNFVAMGRRLADRDAASVLSRTDQDPPLLLAALNGLEAVAKILG